MNPMISRVLPTRYRRPYNNSPPVSFSSLMLPARAILSGTIVFASASYL
jgi:hypothetical protein